MKKRVALILLIVIVGAVVVFFTPAAQLIEQFLPSDAQPAAVEDDPVINDVAQDDAESQQETDNLDEGETAVNPNSTETAPEETEPIDPVDLATFDPPATFISNEDGFQFRNYSSRFPEGNLTIAEARAMFGDNICKRVKNDGSCVPHPKVTAWLDYMNEMMNESGHCVGFTVSSSQIHSQFAPLPESDAAITYDLSREVPVLRTISQAYASFYASNVWTQEVSDKTPTEVLQAIMLADEPVDIGIYYPRYGLNGHSVLGHNVIDQGDGIFHILVYDSNRPGEDNVIVVDTNEDTWFYADGAVNPDEAVTDYRGDAESKSLAFTPMSAYNEPLACPSDFAELCSTNDGARFSVIKLTGKGSALVDSVNGQLGGFGDALINTLPGGRLLAVRGELHSRQYPVLLLPSDELFTLQVQANQADEPLALSLASPTLSVVVEELLGQPDQIDQLNFDPTTQQADFVAGAQQRPSFQYSFAQGDDVYSVQIVGLGFNTGGTFGAAFDAASGDLQLNSDGLEDNQAVLIVSRLSPSGEAIFASPGVIIPSGVNQALDLDGWDGTGLLTLQTDEDGDGEYETTTDVENEPIVDALATVFSPELIVETLEKVLPHLNEEQSADVAAALPTLNLPGDVLGGAYLQFPALQPEDLAGSLLEANLTPDEIGEFTVALRLNPDETAVLLDQVELADGERTIVETTIAAQEEIVDALDEWDFQNTNDSEQVATFIEEQGLDTAQTVDFLADVDLPQGELGAVRRTYASNANVGACSQESLVRSHYIIVNKTSAPITFSWVDFECVERPPITLPPGGIGGGGTFVTHTFVVRNQANELMLLETPDGFVYTHVAKSPGGAVIIVRE